MTPPYSDVSKLYDTDYNLKVQTTDCISRFGGL